MESQASTAEIAGNLPIPHSQKTAKCEKESFEEWLISASYRIPDNSKSADHIPGSRFSTTVASSSDTWSVRNDIGMQKKAIEQYQKMSDWEKYKDDQLLSNPGGDHYYLDGKSMVTTQPERNTFVGRIQKDLYDSFANARNFVQDFLFGSKMYYRGPNNQIMETDKRGVIGSFFDFFKSFGSAMSFGLWRPNGEKEPEGFFERIIFTFSNIKKAIFGDIVEGVGNSVLNMGEDLALSLWNLVETIPDATIGNSDMGKKITTTIFDNGQVAIDYLTDIMPTGEAWLRVHAFDITNLQDLELPLIYNIKLPEFYSDDERWSHVRNTPFRKAIETVGSIIADIVTVELLGDTKLFSEKARDRH